MQFNPQISPFFQPPTTETNPSDEKTAILKKVARNEPLTREEEVAYIEIIKKTTEELQKMARTIQG